MIGLIDAHCHLADEKLKNYNLSKDNDIAGVLSVALNLEQANWHKANAQAKMQWIAGNHPLFTVSFTIEQLEQLIQEKAIIGIGEIGFDKRANNLPYQKDLLLEQLALANDYDLPVVFHVVKEYYQLLKIIKNNFPKTRGFFHSFNSSLQVMKEFENFAFSFNCNFSKIEILQKAYADKKLLLETDSPYQKPFTDTKEFNTPQNIISSCQEKSGLLNIPKEKLIQAQYNCFNQIFG